MAAEFLKCTICYDIFTSPRILPCLHTFCEACLQRHIEMHAQRTGILARYYGTFPCPTCREQINIPVNGVAGFRHDFRVSQFQDWVQQNGENTNKPKISHSSRSLCDVCKVGESVRHSCAFCMTCKKLLCRKCSDKHCRKSIFSEHVIVEDESNEINMDQVPCGKHKGEVIKYICLKCNTGICGICSMTSHDSHSVTDLHNGLHGYHENMEFLRKSVTTRVSQLCHMMKDICLNEKQLDAYKIEIVNEIKEKTGEIILHIKDQEKVLLNDIEEKYKTQREQYSTAKNETELSIVSMESLQEFTSDLLTKKPSPQMLPIYQELVLRMDKVLEESLNIKVNNGVGSWKFIPAKSKHKLGRIKYTGTDPPNDNSPLSARTSDSDVSQNSNNARPRTWTVSNFPKAHAISKIGRQGHKTGEFDSPRDVTFLPDGTFAVADTTNNRIQIFNTDGSIVGVIGEGQVKPWGIATTLEGNIAVADAIEKCIKIFSVNGLLLSKFGQFLCPCGITIDKKGEIVVTDFFSTCIYIMNHSGVVTRKFEFRDRNDRHASGASRVSIGSNDAIVVSDISNASVKIFDERGKLLSKICDREFLASPHGVCVDKHDNVFVADMAQQQVSIFNMAGRFLHRLFPNNGDLKDPLGLAMSSNNTLVITEGKTNQVGVYKVDCSPHSLVVKLGGRATNL